MTSPPPRFPTSDDPRDAEIARLRLLHRISQEFNSSLDFDALLPKVFNAVLDAVGAQGGSIWIAHGDVLRCELALGAGAKKALGSEVPIGTGFVGDVARKQRSTIVTDAIHDPRFQDRLDRSSTMLTTTVMAAPMVATGETVGSIQVSNKVRGDIFDDHDRELLEGLAAAAAVALRNARLHAAEKRARDLALLLEISREVTSTLDIDRVLQSVVNLATRALPFDIGAVGLYQRGKCEIRAIAGEDTVDAKADRTVRLAARGTWALERGETYYLPDAAAAASETDRAFVSAFGDALEIDDVRSGLYLPLRDEEGALGVLLFEAAAPDFANETQRELIAILANQTTVALRNAELYNQVPLADFFGAVSRKRRRFLELPRRRVGVTIAAVVLALAALTLIRWPLRVVAVSPAFRAAGHTVVRPMVDGVVENVLVREGSPVRRGDPLVQLRVIELRTARTTVLAAAATAERQAAAAAAAGDAVTERLQRDRVTSFRQEAALLDEQVEAATVRASVDGVVLSPRPEDLIGTRPEAGDPLLLLGRSDTLELDFGVAQRDMDRVRPGQDVRLRVDAFPQRTFRGRVTFIGPLPHDSSSDPLYALRALVPNPDGQLRPGMAAHARVLTDGASVLGRLFRGPARWARLLWWRLTP